MNANNELLRAAKDAVYQGLADDDGLLEGEPLRARLINLRAAIAAAESAQPDHKDAVMRERYPLLQDDAAATRMALHKAIRDLTDGPASDDLSNEELVGVLFNAAKLAACIDVPRDLMIDLRAAIARAEASASQPAAVPSEAEPEPESEPAPTDPERALLGWVADNCGLTVAQEAELARRLESLRQPAPPLTGPNYMDQEEWGHAPAPATDAEIDDAIEALEDAVQIQTRHEAAASDRWIALGKAKHDARTALRALIARRVAEARAETQQELSDLHAELDEVRDERNEACAELARLRAGGCARDQTTTQFCAEAVELQRENERLRAELAAQDRATKALVQRLTGGEPTEPSPRELAIRELEALRDDLVNVAGAPAPAWAIQRIDARLAKLREVRP